MTSALSPSSGSRLRTLVKAVGVNLLVLLVALFLASEWFIARKAKTTLLYDHNPHYRQDLRPGQRYQREGFSYSIGAHGLRGPVPVVPRPKGTIRIAVMGGSSVFDFRVETSWPERLQSKLRSEGFSKLEVMNAGIPGFSTRELIPFYERKVRQFQPNVVLVYAGWNDLKYMKAFRRRVELRPYAPRPPGTPNPYAFLTAPRPLRNVYALQKFWEKILLRLSAPTQPPRFVAENRAAQPRTSSSTATSSVEPWSKSAGLKYWQSNLRRFVELVRGSGAEVIIVSEAMLATPDLPKSERARIAYHFVRLSHEEVVEVASFMQQGAHELAAELGVASFDPRASISGRPQYFHDHVHLSEAGSEALAQALLPELKAWLRRHQTP